MTPEQAAWVRENVWTGSMRKTYREVPGFFQRCACESGRTSWCVEGKHGRCHRATPMPHYETVITTKSEQVTEFAASFTHPTVSATGWRCERVAMVWLADRVCRWVCPCECHTAPAGAGPAVFEAVALFDVAGVA